ncbi:MAG: DNA repair protein RadC [Chitinispirillales bacterium]|jgi:DNA repair protein RadC|nr:DNA repair protein RadC [Chitinispirillales bacterium]
MQAEGHRSRILERYEKSGVDAFHDYEILELFLTIIIPRKDVKPIAKELISKYKSISGVLSAPRRELEETDGLAKRSVSLIKFIRDMQGFCLKEEITKSEFKIKNKNDIARYLSFNFGNLQEEYLILFLLDAKNAVISAEIAAKGSAANCPIQPRKLFDRALQVKAAGVIIAHNHPANSLNPSNADWDLTQKIVSVGETLEIPLIDHVIIAGNNVLSMRENQSPKAAVWK